MISRSHPDHDRAPLPAPPSPAIQLRNGGLTRCAQTAIRKLVKKQQGINFRAVARTGGVSLDFLYANADLRSPI